MPCRTAVSEPLGQPLWRHKTKMPAPPVRRASLPGARWCWGCASPPRVPRGRGGLVARAMPQEDPMGPSAGCRNNELLGEAADETAPRVARGLAAPSAPVQRTGEKGGTRGGAARESGPGTTPFPPPQPIPTALWLPLPSRLSRLASPPPPAILGWGLRSIVLGVPVPPEGLRSISVRVLGGPNAPYLGAGGGMWQSQGHPCPLPWLSTGRGARRGWGGPCRISPSGVR